MFRNSTRTINFEKYLLYLTITSLVLITLKLSWCYAALIPALLIFIKIHFNEIRNFTIHPIGKISIILLISILLSACFGIEDLAVTWKAVSKLLKFALIFICIPMFAWAIKRTSATKLIQLLVIGQSLAALHSIVNFYFPSFLPRLFIGTVTESGQLSLCIPLAFGLLHEQLKNYRLTKKDLVSPAAITLLAFLGITLNSFYLRLLICLSILLIFSWNIIQLNKNNITSILSFICLMTCGLILNLKRGPFLGVFIGLSIFYLIVSKRIMLSLILVSILLGISISPLRERLLDSYQHFSITGGRLEIWSIGFDLVRKLPLGVGYENSNILQHYSTEVPPELRHFHNNFLNIAVELGWLSLLIFIWWLSAIIYPIFSSAKHRDNFIILAAACSLISLQAAGLVEYNFGDSEIIIIMFFIIGLIYSYSGLPSLLNANATPSSSTDAVV